jgi:hypothetical protein
MHEEAEKRSLKIANDLRRTTSGALLYTLLDIVNPLMMRVTVVLHTWRGFWSCTIM